MVTAQFTKMLNQLILTKDGKSYIITAIPFGSRRWGGYRPGSDYDFVVSEEDLEELSKVIPMNPIIFGSDYNRMYNVSNMKFEADSIKGKITINLISYYKKDMPKIETLVKLMDIVSKDINEIKIDKDKRVYWVEGLLDLLFEKGIKDTPKIDVEDTFFKF